MEESTGHGLGTELAADGDEDRVPVSSVRRFVPFSELETREGEQDDEVFGAKKISDEFSFAPCLRDTQWQCPVDLFQHPVGNVQQESLDMQM